MSDDSPMHFAEICMENYALRAQAAELREVIISYSDSLEISRREGFAQIENNAALRAQVAELEQVYRAGLKQGNPVYKLVLDERDVLRAQVAELREALKPFAEEADRIEKANEEDPYDRPPIKDTDCHYSKGYCLSMTPVVGDFRRARAALEMSGGVK